MAGLETESTPPTFICHLGKLKGAILTRTSGTAGGSSGSEEHTSALGRVSANSVSVPVVCCWLSLFYSLGLGFPFGKRMGLGQVSPWPHPAPTS